MLITIKQLLSDKTMYTLYNLFRNIIEDTTGEYTEVNTTLLKYLDAAIRKMGELHDYIIYQEINVTQEILDSGYIELSNKPIEILDGIPEDYRQRGWDYTTGNRIRIIDKRYFNTGNYCIRYRAAYKQYQGQMREDSYFDFSEDSYLAIVLYAIGFYTKMNKVVNEDGSFGTIRRKTEENLTVEYAVGGDIAIAQSPEGMMESAIEMFRDMPNGQDLFFSA